MSTKCYEVYAADLDNGRANFYGTFDQYKDAVMCLEQAVDAREGFGWGRIDKLIDDEWVWGTTYQLLIERGELENKWPDFWG